MTDFISLKSGLIINVGAAAFIHPQPGPSLGERGIEIVFPSVAVEGELGARSSLTVILMGDEADEFIAKAKAVGIDVAHLVAARKTSGLPALSGDILGGQANVRPE